jgi:hypothetical protein
MFLAKARSLPLSDAPKASQKLPKWSTFKVGSWLCQGQTLTLIIKISKLRTKKFYNIWPRSPDFVSGLNHSSTSVAVRSLNGKVFMLQIKGSCHRHLWGSVVFTQEIIKLRIVNIPNIGRCL